MALKHAAFLDVIDLRTPRREHGKIAVAGLAFPSAFLAR